MISQSESNKIVNLALSASYWRHRSQYLGVSIKWGSALLPECIKHYWILALKIMVAQKIQILLKLSSKIWANMR